MNLVFLDIDGVLNSTESITKNRIKGIKNPDEVFIPKACQMLEILQKKRDVKFVISSTWRYNMDNVKETFKKNNLNLNIIGKTPFIEGGIRGAEIQKFLDELGFSPNSFLIIDDDDDMGHLMSYLIHVDRNYGLRKKDFSLAYFMLGGK